MSKKPTYRELEERMRELERTPREQDRSAGTSAATDVDALVDTIPCALYGYIRWPDGRSRFVYMSSQCERIFEHDAESIVADPDLLWGMVHPDDVERLRREDAEANRAGRLFQSEVRIVLPTGRERWIQLSSMPSPQRVESQVLWSGVILDVTERKMLEVERDRMVQELRAALEEIRTLEGILPICSFCKKIRDEDGEWEPVEVYIRGHAGTDFSHGICPECVEKHYPDI